MQSDFLLIAAPTKAGEAFMKHTKLVGLPFVALTNNKMERIKLERVNPRLIYKGLGADYVIYSTNGDVKFLISSLKTNKRLDSV